MKKIVISVLLAFIIQTVSMAQCHEYIETIAESEGQHVNTNNSSSSSSSSSSGSSTTNKNSGHKTTTVVVEHHRDPVPVQDWVPCSVCGHNPGVCQTCVGNKTNYRGDPCISCRGTGKCHFCNGQGGRYQIVYR